MNAESQPEKAGKKRGPKPDLRPHLDIRVQPDIFDALEALEAIAGTPPEQTASMLLHMLIRDPENIASRLRALLGSPPEPPSADDLPRLMPRTRGIRHGAN